MVNIKLAPKQVIELKKFYVGELKILLERVDEVKDILNKLENNPSVDVSENIINNDSKGTVLSTAKKDITQGKDLRFRKTKNPNWRLFVTKILKELQKPLTVSEIMRLYEKKNNEKVIGNKKYLNSLSQALFRLRVVNKRIISKRVKNQKEKVYLLLGQTQGSEGIPQTRKQRQKKTILKTSISKSDKGTSRDNYDWAKFIFETLTKTKRVLTEKEFFRYALVYFNIPKKDSVTIKGKLKIALSDLVKKGKHLKRTTKEGHSITFYALPEWVNNNHELKTEFK